MINKTKTGVFEKIRDFFVLIISMAGYVPKNATIIRTIVFLFSLAFAFYIGKYQPDNPDLAIIYFILSELFYLGFITIVLSENGLRHWFKRRFGSESKGYLAYEGILGILFFHNGASIGYIASSTTGNLFDFFPENFLFIMVTVMVIGGFIIKILAAKAVSIEIYYWKDMFMGRKICEFVVSGPYKYFSNPMYGIGQIQAYATAIWYGSIIGLTAAFLNQFLIFTFFYLVEKKFIKRVYQ